MQDLHQSPEDFEDTGAREAMAEPARNADRPVSNAANVPANAAAEAQRRPN